MDFYCTSTFERTFRDFCKKKNLFLNSCKKDIPEALNIKGLDFNDCGWIMKEHEGKEFTIYKAKIANSGMQKGKRGGFRLYFAHNEITENIVLMELLHKSGKQGKSQLAPKALKNEIKELLKEYQEGELIKLSVINGEITISSE